MPSSPQSSTRKDLFTENDLNSLKQGIDGYGVYSGLTATVGTGLQVVIATGSAYFAGTKVTKSSTTSVNLTAANATLPRRDIIVLASDGTISAVDGTAALQNVSGDSSFQLFDPYPPAVPSGKIILCEIFVGAAATSLSSPYILDKRVLLDGDVLRSGENVVLKSGGTLNVYASDGITLVFKIDESGNVFYKGRMSAL